MNAARTDHHPSVNQCQATQPRVPKRRQDIDGQPAAFTVVVGADNGTWLADITLRDNICIGAERYSAVSGYFNGTIKDVRYYSRALSAAEIGLDYASYF